MKKLNEAGHTMEIGPKYYCGGFEEFWYVPLKWKEDKKRWVGIQTLSRSKSTDVIRIEQMDLYAGKGFAASADDPKTLCYFHEAVDALHRREVSYIAYIPDEDDDPALAKQINARLCPIELEARNGPTYTDMVNAEEAMRPSDTERVTEKKLIPLLADVAVGPFPDEIELVSYTGEKLTMRLNAYRKDHGDSTTYTQEWIEDVLNTELGAAGQYIVFALTRWSIRITRETDENNEVSYWFEKITSHMPYPYTKFE
ncbi:hypothetical protein P4B35_20840 [Pontiellaceae bacterium B12227]|nr:hypothetical protein [Pontiellaceae bacterium B12227]